MAMNKYGRATKMTSPPPGMPAGMAKKYAEIEGNLEKVVTMNRGLIEGGGLKYDPNEMVEIDDKKTGKKTKVPYGSYEHQVSIYTPKDRFAKNFMGIGPNDAGVQRFRGNDLSNYNENPENIRLNAGLKTEELRTSKGSTIFSKGSKETNYGGVYQQQYESPIKGVTDLPSRYAKEQGILSEYGGLKGDLSKMDADWAELNKPMVPPKLKRDLPKLQGKISDLPEETTWKNPEASKYKTKREIVKSREGGQDKKIRPFSTQLVSKKEGGVRKMPSFLVSKKGEEVQVAKGLRYNREEKMAKAFYAPESLPGTGGYSSRTEDAWDDQGYSKDMSKVIKSDIKSIRQEKRDYIADKGRNPSDARGEYNKAIKTAKLASRYAKRADISASGDETWKEGEGSKLKYFTPDYEKNSSKKLKGAMYGYSEAGKQERSRMNQLQGEAQFQAYPHSKTAEQNVVNRNSTSERMKKFWGF
jgi:hypothetical protein